MNLPPTNQHAIEALRRFYTLLPRSPDVALVVLKIHLLVEEQVRAFVDERVESPTTLKRADLTCHQAILLAEAISTEEIHPNMWEAARKLNDLRNKIAHNLEPAGVLERMNNFCTLIGFTPQAREATAPSPRPSPLEDFQFAASMLHNEISLYVKRKPAELIQLVPPAQNATQPFHRGDAQKAAPFVHPSCQTLERSFREFEDGVSEQTARAPRPFSNQHKCNSLNLDRHLHQPVFFGQPVNCASRSLKSRSVACASRS